MYTVFDVRETADLRKVLMTLGLREDDRSGSESIDAGETKCVYLGDTSGCGQHSRSQSSTYGRRSASTRPRRGGWRAVRITAMYGAVVHCSVLVVGGFPRGHSRVLRFDFPEVLEHIFANRLAFE